MITIKCIKCGKNKDVYPSRLKRNKPLYCSKKCFYNNRQSLTEEQKKKISEGTRNNPPSTIFKKGDNPWNTGKKGYSTSRKGKSFEETVGKHKAKEWKKRLSNAKKGRTHIEIFGEEEAKKRIRIIKEKVHPIIKGKPRLDMVEKWAKARKPYNYDISKTELQRLRKHGQYKLWREKVLKKDNYACIKCGSKENIEADHVIPIFENRHLMLEVSNGQVLCKKCHKKKTREEHKRWLKPELVDTQ